MEAVLRFHEIGNRAGLQGEGGLLEFGNRLPARDPADVAAVILAGVFGILLGESGEVAAVLGLLQNALGRLANLLYLGIGLAHSLEEDVGDVHAIFDTVEIDVGVIVGALLVFGDLHALAQRREVQARELDDALLRHGVLGFVLFKICGEVRVAGVPLWRPRPPASGPDR